MRTSILNKAFFLVALLSAKLVNGGHDGIFVEQESASTASLTAQPSSAPSEVPPQTFGASASATAAISTAQASGSAESSASASEAALSTSSPSSHKSARASSITDIPSASTPSLVSHPTGVNGTIAKHHDPLPLQPEITPALGIAGAILIGTGLVYALIGIKNKWLHIFLSTAYLTSLSVTVLIVYVMNPPIRNSIQGAYFVAVFFTGLVFGGCSLIFQDVTEGLGCLLGGYCVGMWLLTLKPGGLLNSTSSKAIFIAVFTVATYALSFNHHTRPYGLIGSTSFAGATAIVLGIDCFSRAGLKEFWLYLWALNDNLFPLDTNTYPFTRGMRVEIASIIIILLVGIISQIKLWKVIKDRREKKNAVRLEDERHRNRMEETVGRRLEEGTNRERVQWEAVYGDRDQRRQNTDSGIGTEEMDTPRKGSISAVEVREVPASTETIEMNTLSDSRKGTVAKRSSTVEANPQAGATVGEGADTVDQTNEKRLGGKPATQSTPKRVSGSSILSSNLVTPKPGPKHVSISEEPAEVTVKAADDSGQTVPPPPVVTPLPFTVPTAEGSEHDTDKSSIATFAEFDEGPARHSKRQSDRSIFKRLSGRSANDVSQSEEALIVPYANRSRASSEAATIEDDASSRRLSLKDTPPQSEEASSSRVKSPVPVGQEVCQVAATQKMSNSIAETFLPQEATSKDQANTNALPSSNGDLDISEFPKPPESPNNFQGLSLTPSTNPPKLKAEDLNDLPKEKQEPPVDTPAPQSSHGKSEKRRSRAVSETSALESLKAQAVEQLPSQVSKIVMSYRTNEWAKHLSGAEPPELDPLDGTITDEAATTLVEPVAPLAVEELKQTALNALPPPAVGNPLQLQSAAPEQVPLSRSTSNMSKPSPHEQRPRASVTGETLPSRAPSQISTSNGGSTSNPTTQSQLQPQISTRGLRSSSSNLVTSPIEENVEATYPPRNVVSPIPTGGPTLMAQRNSRVRNKYSSTALNVGLSDSNLQLAGDTSFYNNPSRSSLQFQSPTSMDDDNISLSQRRELLQSRPSSAQAISPLPLQTRLSSQYSSFDSHQPQRQPSAVDPHKREAMLATWRESMRHDVATMATPEATVEQRRADMLLEKHQSMLGRQHQEVEKKYRDEAMDQAMRRRDMMEAHKEAMRRMQASANKHV